MEVVVRYLVEGEPDQLKVRLLAGVEPELSFERPEGLRWYPSAPPGGP
jgi:hypothetical protein